MLRTTEVKTIISLVLYMGNFVNGGTARGQADGFGLEILSKLKGIINSIKLLNIESYEIIIKV